MPLPKTLIRKNLNVCCCINIIKRPPSPPSDDLHRPSSPSTPSWLPLYLKKFSSLNFSPSAVTNAADSIIPSSASTSDYEADGEGEVEAEEGASTPDLSSVYASPRFFFSSPGLSNSILDSASSTSEEDGGKEEAEAEEEEVAVQRESPDPYSDFRRSMEEMVEARDLHDVPANWDSLQELLLRYLSLNPEPNHKFIAGAFADLLVSLMSSPPPSAVASDSGVSAASAAAPAGCSCY